MKKKIMNVANWFEKLKYRMGLYKSCSVFIYDEKRMNKLLGSFFICCLLAACSSGSSSSEMLVPDEGVTIIPMDAKPGDVLNLSEFAESIELIPLETTDDCLIGWMPEIIATEKYYYMISAVGYDFQKLYVFDKQGKFVRQISSRGQGGG